MPQAWRETTTAALAYVILSAVILTVALMLLAGRSYGRTLYPGQWAQVDPETRKWFNSQVVPGGSYKGSSCCSLADGAYAEEDIRGDHYWTRFTYSLLGVDHDTGWMEVPDNAVIHNPNRHGRTVVWYGVDDDIGDVSIFIRCFAPGGGF
jgi:hypothetical protein